jgi:putative colanic acid biosynthesis acetyltransferase WcaF
VLTAYTAVANDTFRLMFDAIAMTTPPSQIALDRYDQSWFKRGRNAVVVLLWDVVQAICIHGSLHPMYGWRRFWYRLFGAQIGAGVRIRRTVNCTYPWKLAIGEHSWIGDQATLYCLECITIASHVVISQQAYLCTGSHDSSDPHFGLIVKPIRIDHGAWVALGALVMPGIHIGEGAVIAARAVLTHDALPWTIYAGAPAKPCSERNLVGRQEPMQSPTQPRSL